MSHAHPSPPRPFDSGVELVPARCAPVPEASGTVMPDGDILGCVVYTHPGRGTEVAQSLIGLSGVQVHCGAEIDKLVVTIEDVVDQPAADRLGALNQIEGVINGILIYHFGGQAIAAKSDRPE